MTRWMGQPAERDRGLVWASRFENAAQVVEDGGAITGTPVINHGVVLDGTNDYLKFEVVPTVFGDAFSFEIEFTPNFAYDDGANHALFSTSSEDYYIRKRDNNQMRIRVGNVTIVNLSPLIYGPYWRVGERNVLALSSVSGDTSATLNGFAILSSSAAAWTNTSPTQVYVGAFSTGGYKFDGTIHSLKLFNQQLTDQEILDYSYGDGRQWRYREDAVVDLPMLMAQHDPTNGRTLDISGNENHGVFGAGAAEPTKNTWTKGYNFDATDDRMELGTGLNVPDDATWAAWVRFTDPVDASSGAILTKWGTAAAARSWAFHISSDFVALYLSSTGANFEVERDNAIDLRDSCWHLIGAVYDKSTNGVEFFVDGVSVSSWTFATATGGANQGTAPVWLGDEYEGSVGGPFDGDLAGVKMWQQKLTPLQVADLYGSELRRINHV